MSKLSYEEQEILEALEQGKLERSKNAVEIQKRHKQYAEAMVKTGIQKCGTTSS